MLTYIVITHRSGFEHRAEFRDLAKAETFYKAECEQIGAPVEFCSINDDNPDQIVWIESYNP